MRENQQLCTQCETEPTGRYTPSPFMSWTRINSLYVRGYLTAPKAPGYTATLTEAAVSVWMHVNGRVNGHRLRM
jgi:hypothetical protein